MGLIFNNGCLISLEYKYKITITYKGFEMKTTIDIIVNEDENSNTTYSEVFHSYEDLNILEEDFWDTVSAEFSEEDYYQVFDDRIELYLTTREDAEWEKNRIDNLLTIWA